MKYRLFAASAALGLAALLPAQEVVKDIHIQVQAGPGPGAVGGMPAFAPQASTFRFIAAEPALFGKPVTGAPYAGEGFTEIVRVLADGTRITNNHSKKVWRDAQGRTREETTLPMLGPWAAQGGVAPKLIMIVDPVAKLIYTLNEKEKTASRRKMPDLEGMMAKMGAAGGAVGGGGGPMIWQTLRDGGDPSATKADVIVPRTPAGASGNVMFTTSALRIGGGDGKEETLGTQIIEGIKVEGKPLTHTIKAGEIGNDRELVSVSERWNSPELQTLIRMTSKDPQMGETTYKLTNISRAEPAASLFQVPADYTITDAAENLRFERRIETK